jgi:hypothetical protein
MSGLEGSNPPLSSEQSAKTGALRSPANALMLGGRIHFDAKPLLDNETPSSPKAKMERKACGHTLRRCLRPQPPHRSLILP